MRSPRIASSTPPRADAQEARVRSYSRLGAAVLAQDRLDDAAGLLAKALAIALGCGDSHGISLAHKELGYQALKQEALEAARQHWCSALDVAWRVHERPHLLVTLDALIGLATRMGQAGDGARAVELLALVHGAARVDRRTETEAEQLLAALERRLSPDRFAAAQARQRWLRKSRHRCARSVLRLCVPVWRLVVFWNARRRVQERSLSMDARHAFSPGS